MSFHQSTAHGLSALQKTALSIMGVLAIVTFFLSNVHALVWQHSAWLVSTVLPAVVVELTNEEREDVGMSGLTRNATLDEAARLKAEHMAKYQYFSHYSPDGVSPWYWFSEAGYVYAHAGENLAIHFTDSTEVVEAWMDSPTHRANIVNGQYTEIGVGTAKGTFDGFDTVYVVQLFGTPAVVPPTLAAVPTPTPSPTPALPTPEVAVVEEVVPFEVTSPSTAVAGDEVALESVLPETPQPETEPTLIAQSDTSETPVVTLVNETVVIESSVATSSGLAIASIVEPRDTTNERTVVAGVMTKPQQLLTTIYLVLAVAVGFLLLVAAVREARRFHFVQVAYSLVLLFVMTGLWFVHQAVTSGAVIV